jgi:hypothetical protein
MSALATFARQKAMRDLALKENQEAERQREASAEASEDLANLRDPTKPRGSHPANADAPE